jgi:hypothetical protein
MFLKRRRKNGYILKTTITKNFNLSLSESEAIEVLLALRDYFSMDENEEAQSISIITPIIRLLEKEIK